MCHTIMNFKEHVASIVNVLIFAGLIKIRFTLRRESTKVLLFPSTEHNEERKSRDREYVLLFTHFVSFFRFQVGSGPPSHRRQSWARSTRRFRRLMRSLWHDRARNARTIASHAYSKTAPSMRKPRNYKYICKDSYPTRVETTIVRIDINLIKISIYLSN